jgi:hypothetical protein
MLVFQTALRVGDWTAKDITMQRPDDIIVIALTRVEAEELFYQCLRRTDEDTPAGVSVLRKLARVLEFEAGNRRSKDPAITVA